MIELEQEIHNIETQEVNSKQEIVEKISEQLKKNNLDFDSTSLEQRQKKLKEKPILESGFLVDTTHGISTEPDFHWVETEKIVGRPFGSRYENGWSFEYDNRKGRAVTVAKEISTLLETENNSQKHEIIEHIFHPDNKMQRIKLDKIQGPSGPMYSVRDGTHRLAGIMTAGLEKIPCDVHKMKYPLENRTNDEYVANTWKEKINLGLIQGKVEMLNDGGQKYRLIVEREVLPWIRTQSQHQLIEISLMYEQLYPNSLDNLEIPRDALIDPIANNYFMDKRWQEWKKNFSQNPRDEKGIVIY